MKLADILRPVEEGFADGWKAGRAAPLVGPGSLKGMFGPSSKPTSAEPAPTKKSSPSFSNSNDIKFSLDKVLNGEKLEARDIETLKKLRKSL